MMYAVFVDDGFDSVYGSKEDAKRVAKAARIGGQPARIRRLTKADRLMLGMEAEPNVRREFE